MRPTRDRYEAGRLFGEALGLPREGVPVAFESARRLGAPPDVFLVPKLDHGPFVST